MTKFTTAGLPRPVITPELDFEATRQLRLGDFVARMLEGGIDYDVSKLEANPGAHASRSAAYGDLYYVARLNDAARVVLLHSFAEGADLDLHAERIGLERLEGEDDEDLRERIRLAWKGKSAAGPDDYYKSRARNVSPRVKDVAVTAETRNSSDRVLIVSVLTTDNGGLADAELLAELNAALNDPSFRSRNVTVEAVAAVITTKNVTANIYLYPEAIQPTDGEPVLRAAHARDQSLSFDLTRSYVEKHLHQPGVQRVELQGWTNAYADFNEAIKLGSVNLTYIRLAS